MEPEKVADAPVVEGAPGTGFAIFNPFGKPLAELPIIWGFNNGALNHRCFAGCLLADDGTWLGDHISSDEEFMKKDLGVVIDGRASRHEDFCRHYPGGFRMEFVSEQQTESHAGLRAAYERHAARFKTVEWDRPIPTTTS